MGNIAPKVLYRSNHPIYKGEQVEAIISAVSSAQIKTIINLSDSAQSLKARIIYCPWYEKMLNENNVITLNMSMALDLADNMLINKIGQAITFMAEHEGPYLIHCEAGMDRVGLMSILLESFMGAAFEEIVKDYMLSFVSASDYSSDDYQQGAAYLQNLFSKIKEDALKPNEDFQALSHNFLTGKVGLNKDILMQLQDKLAFDISAAAS